MSADVVENGRAYNALWWAKVQSGGPQKVPADTPAVAGLARAVEPDGSGLWMLPTVPDGAGHGVLEELGAPPVAVEMPNETARVLAICVACCWTDRDASTWPGVTGTLAQVKAVYAGMRGRAEQSSDLTLIIGSLRRLHATHWLLWNEKAGEVRLGPRTITWSPSDLATLREICRVLPDPPPAVLVARAPEPTPDPLPVAASADGPAPSSDQAAASALPSPAAPPADGAPGPTPDPSPSLTSTSPAPSAPARSTEQSG
ncbi:hypothetical protein Kfla_4679 [Kribbella flavida DSM 17836]|uniref:Uncharacterized protein n=1 Tax=Kribbella flavida (strain DSM 17836 / JCM 10339 / NBRC 14399) TaxID=479435 RepID=D2PZ88_KRIFD|nr:hypothetical protein [Kribbella flavida]ADB33697.1 hypothetical protein Kfla_4679 [Kribbella flavida DSM 17836]